MAKSVESSHSTTDKDEFKMDERKNEDLSLSENRIVEDSEMDRRVWRKIDMYVLPVVAMFYLLSFLDRTNVGNARVAGLQKDLKMSNKEYSIALTVTYVPYIVAELPSNLMLKAVGPNLMLPTMLTLWGLVTTLQGIVKSYSGLLACRFFLGLLEGGVFPGLVLYLSYFYPRYKMNTRVIAFYSAASLSGAFSGILAYGIVHMDGVGGRPGWAWIFILEGLFTILAGISSYFTLPRSIDHAWFFTSEEKAYVNAVLLDDNAHIEEDGFTWKEIVEATKLPQMWLMIPALFCEGCIVYSLAYFLPSIIQGLGYTAAKAQLMSVPPFAVGLVVSVIASFISDRYQCRGPVAIGGTVFATIGFAMFLGSKSEHVQYGSLFLSIPGAYTTSPTGSAWVSNNASPQTRRATAIAISFILTNLGGILATWLLGSLSSAPRYTSGTIILLVFSILTGMSAGANLLYLWNQNKKKVEIRRTIRREEEKVGLGDRSAWFVYNL